MNKLIAALLKPILYVLDIFHRKHIGDHTVALPDDVVSYKDRVIIGHYVYLLGAIKEIDGVREETNEIYYARIDDCYISNEWVLIDTGDIYVNVGTSWTSIPDMDVIVGVGGCDVNNQVTGDVVVIKTGDDSEYLGITKYTDALDYKISNAGIYSYLDEIFLVGGIVHKHTTNISGLSTTSAVVMFSFNNVSVGSKVKCEVIGKLPSSVYNNTVVVTNKKAYSMFGNLNTKRSPSTFTGAYSIPLVKATGMISPGKWSKDKFIKLDNEVMDTNVDLKLGTGIVTSTKIVVADKSSVSTEEVSLNKITSIHAIGMDSKGNLYVTEEVMYRGECVKNTTSPKVIKLKDIHKGCDINNVLLPKSSLDCPSCMELSHLTIEVVNRLY